MNHWRLKFYSRSHDCCTSNDFSWAMIMSMILITCSQTRQVSGLFQNLNVLEGNWKAVRMSSTLWAKLRDSFAFGLESLFWAGRNQVPMSNSSSIRALNNRQAHTDRHNWQTHTHVQMGPIRLFYTLDCWCWREKGQTPLDKEVLWEWSYLYLRFGHLLKFIFSWGRPFSMYVFPSISTTPDHWWSSSKPPQNILVVLPFS